MELIEGIQARLRHVKLAYGSKIGSGESAAELASKPNGQLYEEFFAIFGAVRALLFVLEDPTANLVNRPDDSPERYLSEGELHRLKVALDEKIFRKAQRTSIRRIFG